MATTKCLYPLRTMHNGHVLERLLTQTSFHMFKRASVKLMERDLDLSFSGEGESVFTIASSVDGELTERALALHPSPSREELITAINFSIRGNAPTFQVLLEKGRDLFSQDDLYNFLKMAFSYGRMDVLDHLRKEGLEMTHTFFRNQNLLYFLTNSAPSILPRMIDEALEAGLDLNFKSEFGSSPVTLAVGQKAWSLARELIERGCDVDITYDKYSETPLFFAARNKMFGVFKQLVANGADFSIKTKSGVDVPSFVVRHGMTGYLEELIENSPDFVEMSSRELEDLLMLAMRNKAYGCAKLLIQLLEADECPDAFTFAVRISSFPLVEAFIRQGHSPHKENRLGVTPLILAFRMKNEPLKSMMMKRMQSMAAAQESVSDEDEEEDDEEEDEDDEDEDDDDDDDEEEEED